MTKHRSELLLFAVALVVLSGIVAFQAFDTKPLFASEPSSKNVTQSITTTNVEKDDTLYELPINLNTATYDQLCTVTGIGDVKAQAILDYRQSVGEFISVDELLNVKGIGDATFNKIKGAFVV